jgi:hypothetical protein
MNEAHKPLPEITRELQGGGDTGLNENTHGRGEKLAAGSKSTSAILCPRLLRAASDCRGFGHRTLFGTLLTSAGCVRGISGSEIHHGSAHLLEARFRNLQW